MTDRLAVIRTGFSPSFWVANTLELFERFAYYGSKAVLAIYLAEQVGLGPETGNLARRAASSTRCSTSCRPSPARSSIATASGAA